MQRKVFKLQRQIYRASQPENVKLVHNLQRLLIKSWYGRLLAVRRVTQDNQGKRTAGINGIKNLIPAQRLQLAHSLSQLPQAQPLRRVWIPKPGKPQKRPLSIPVMADRAAQALSCIHWLKSTRTQFRQFGARQNAAIEDWQWAITQSALYASSGG